MKIDTPNKFNALIPLRPSSSKVFRIIGSEIYFTGGNVPPNYTIGEARKFIEEAPANSIPRTQTKEEVVAQIASETATEVLADLAAQGGTPDDIPEWDKNKTYKKNVMVKVTTKKGVTYYISLQADNSNNDPTGNNGDKYWAVVSSS